MKICAEEPLQCFLYEANALQDYDLFFQMFNSSFDIAAIVKHHIEFLQDELEEFKKQTESREVKYQGVHYVHAMDLVQQKTSQTSRLNKKFTSLLE